MIKMREKSIYAALLLTLIDESKQKIKSELNRKKQLMNGKHIDFYVQKTMLRALENMTF